MRRIVVLTWSWILIFALYGFVCHQLGMETSQEFDKQTLGTQGSVEECRWEKIAFVSTIFFEVTALLMSTISATLFVYTATRGFQQEQRINLHGLADQTSFFFMRFKSFKRIVKVLLIVLFLDILATGVRITKHWLPQLALFQLVHLLRMLFIIIEAWTYGLGNPSVRGAIKKLFGCRSGQVHDEEIPAVRRPRENVHGDEEIPVVRSPRDNVDEGEELPATSRPRGNVHAVRCPMDNVHESENEESSTVRRP